MKKNRTALAIELSAGWIVDLLLMTALLSLLSVPLALAGEDQASFEGENKAQPTIDASASPDAENSLEETLKAQLPEASVDFLMERSPALYQASPSATTQVMTSTVPGPETVPVRLPDIIEPMQERPEEVAMLVSEQCSQNGAAAEGTSSCERVYSNGHHATVLTQSANEGDELKRQTVIEEFDGDNTLLFKKTIRQRVDYNYLNDQKAKEKEFFDIIYQPAGRKTTRELMVYEYFLDTGKAKSLSWTQYQQIANEPKAELAYHASLRYGDDGSPDRGIAEGWDHGKKVETFMNWSRQSKGFATLDEEAWGQWEGWIRNVSLQAYLP